MQRMDLSERRDVEKYVEIDGGTGAKFGFAYRPFVFTPETLKRSLDAQEQAKRGDADAASDLLAGVILESLASWNLTDKGEAVPLTREGLRRVDFALQADIINNVQGRSLPPLENLPKMGNLLSHVLILGGAMARKWKKR